MAELSQTLVRPQFRRPEESLEGADAKTVGSLIATAADLAIVVDGEGVVRDVAVSADGIPSETVERWISRPALETVTVECRQKMADLVQGTEAESGLRWREVNHPLGGGMADLPISYTALRAEPTGKTVLLGRDLRSVAVLQRRLISAQQSMEQDYGRLLTMEARYRLLFETTGEAFLVADAVSGEVIEANSAAGILFGEDVARLSRRSFPFGFDQAGLRAAAAAAGTVRGTGRPETISLRLAATDRQVDLTISLFRAENRKLFLARFVPEPGTGELGADQAPLLALPRRATEAIVLADPEGKILWGNESFLDLAQIAALEQVRNASLDRFFSRRGIDLSVMLSNAREHGRLRFFSTTLTGTYGSSTDVEVSIVRLPEIEGGGFGFIMRNVALRPEAGVEGTSRGSLPHSAEQMTDLVGRVPLKDLVRDTVDVIEQLCIEAALRMTGDNRASAADLLGLSRQSLYVKLRRYGISEIEVEGRD